MMELRNYTLTIHKYSVNVAFDLNLLFLSVIMVYFFKTQLCYLIYFKIELLSFLLILSNHQNQLQFRYYFYRQNHTKIDKNVSLKNIYCTCFDHQKRKHIKIIHSEKSYSFRRLNDQSKKCLTKWVSNASRVHIELYVLFLIGIFSMEIGKVKNKTPIFETNSTHIER